MYHTVSVGDLVTLTTRPKVVHYHRWLSLAVSWLSTTGMHTVCFTTASVLSQVQETFPVHLMTLTQLLRRPTITSRAPGRWYGPIDKIRNEK